VNVKELTVTSTDEHGCARFWHAAQAGDAIQVLELLHAGEHAVKEETESSFKSLMAAVLGGQTAQLVALLDMRAGSSLASPSNAPTLNAIALFSLLCWG
jgi:hypothetical protein